MSLQVMVSGLEFQVFASSSVCVAANDSGVKGANELAMNIIEGERQRNLQQRDPAS